MKEQFAQHVSAVGALGEALDGTPAKRKRAAKRANPNSEVTTNVVCYCHERFDDLVDFSTHVRGGCPELVRVSELRRRDGTRLIAECGTRSGLGRHLRLGEKVCDSCRSIERERDRQRRANPEYRERERERDRKRYSTPEYRERSREGSREWRARKKAERDSAMTEAAGMPQPDPATTNQLEGVCL